MESFWRFDFSTLLPSLLCLIGTAYCINAVSQLLGERKWHVNSGLWFATSVGALTYANVAQMEIYLCLFYSAAWLYALRFLASPPSLQRWANLFIAFFIAGLMALIKSPLYSVLWTISFISYLLVSGNWLLFKEKRLYLAILFGVAVGLIWFLFILNVDGETFLNQYWFQESVGKQAGNGGTLKSLWLPVLLHSVPWTLLGIVALRSTWISRRASLVIPFVTCWAWPVGLFFSLYPYRTSVYLFLLQPAIAILVDWGCYRSSQTKTYRRVFKSTGVLIALALIVCGLIFAFTPSVSRSFAILLLGLGSFIWIPFFKGAEKLAAFAMLLVIAAFLLHSGLFLRQADLGLKQQLKTAGIEKIVAYNPDKNIWHEAGFLSVQLQKPVRSVFSVDQMEEAFGKEHVAVHLTDAQFDALGRVLGEIASQKNRSLEVILWPRFKRKEKIHFLNFFRSPEQFMEAMHREDKMVYLGGLATTPSN